MSSSLRPFQIILIGAFIALAVGGLIFFAVFQGVGGRANPYGKSVEIWGTLDGKTMSMTLAHITDADENFQVVSYREKDPRTFHADLANAIAEGRGPDAIVLSSDWLLSERAKLYPIPYDALPLRDIKDRYVDGAEIFALSDGMYGFPIAVDPLVLYWNRGLFSSAGLAAPPATWETVVSQAVPSLARVGQSRIFTVDRAALAFGEYANVQHASAIMLALLMQAGSPLIVENGDRYEAHINQSRAQTARPPAEAALDFYTQFANPSRPVYTWNRSLAQDRSAFLAEDLAMYFGLGSEYAGLRAGNPNLDFDAAQIPQGSGAPIKYGYGTFYSVAILRGSDNFEGAYRASSVLGKSANAQAIAEGSGLAPVDRGVLAAGAPDPLRQTLYTAALIARGFLDPDPPASSDIIKTMIEDVTSGRASASQAVQDAVGRFNQLLLR
jgi:ABC-type glycerol-3-phosphate transport system substrate-binding protein